MKAEKRAKVGSKRLVEDDMMEVSAKEEKRMSTVRSLECLECMSVYDIVK